jgi:hypothetical protein
MLYMLLPVHGPRAAPGEAPMAMPGMGTSAGPAGFPALAAVLALFMLGYIVWTTDRLTVLARAPATAADQGGDRHRRPSAAARADAPAHDAGGAVSTPAAGSRAGRPVLAPKLAVCGKLAMSITMGYMLILML